MKLLLIFMGAIASACWNVSFAAAAPSQPLPNIVIIFADDLGYGDIGVYGAKGIKTPHLDRLARDGRRFISFYTAQPVCSASRAALLTGCYPNRIGISGALGPNSSIGISSNETTLAELVKQKGYATAIVGKWHLGHLPAFLPTRHGFDSYYGLPYSNDMWPYHPEAKKGTYPDLPLIEGENVVGVNPDQNQLTQNYTRRAVEFIQNNKNRSFFLYLAHSMPHVPIFASDKFRGRNKAGRYGDVIEELDWSVGEVISALRKTGLEKNTLLIFTSDNGPWLSYGNHAGSAGELREGKGTIWEGGVRVPCIMSWPGKIPENTEAKEPAMSIDLFPTIARLVRANLPTHKIDGRDIWPLMAGLRETNSLRQPYFFYYNNNDLLAVRSNKWKLILPQEFRSLAGRPGGTNGFPAKYETLKTDLALYDLERDPSETRNIARRNPEIVKELQALLAVMRSELGDDRFGLKGKGARPPGRIVPTEVKFTEVTRPVPTPASASPKPEPPPRELAKAAPPVPSETHRPDALDPVVKAPPAISDPPRTNLQLASIPTPSAASHSSVSVRPLPQTNSPTLVASVPTTLQPTASPSPSTPPPLEVLDTFARARSELREYRNELNRLRAEFAVSDRLPDERFFLFGMGLRPKFLYKGGKLISVPDGKILHDWKARDEIIVPSDYLVIVKLESGETIEIQEDASGIWFTTAEDHTRIEGTHAKVMLPDFVGHRYARVLRVLHQELLVNVTTNGPVPNIFVYSKPWYRDGAMMALAFQRTGNLNVVRDWILGLREPFDRNNAGETEADNLGQALYLASLVGSTNHLIVKRVLAELPKFEKHREGDRFISGRSDFAEHPVYQTKWLKYGLRALGLPDPYVIPPLKDGYSALFWMDYKDAYVAGADAHERRNYPYLGWACDHFHGEKRSPISNRDYPLTWEAHASQANYAGNTLLSGTYVAEKIAAPHTWHAAEAFLYLLDAKH